MTRLIAFALVASLAAGCALAQRLTGHRSGASEPSAAEGPSEDAPAALKVAPLAHYQSYQATYAKTLLAELEAGHATPAKRTRSDVAIVLELHAIVNPMYMEGDPADKTVAVAQWRRANEIAQLPANTGPQDELVSEPLRRAALALGSLDTSIDPGAGRRNLAGYVRDHEASFLGGKPSARARALLEDADAFERAHPELFAKAKKQADARARYDADPEVTKLAADWLELNRDAERTAERVGEEHPRNWAHSSHPALAKHREQLARYQAMQRRLRKKHGVPE
ncbi:MAG: hypothetical protein JWP01_449 [Myxococcales bacterium]|nr:hypothetical protein [Myxococcales bacterium]